MRRTVAFVWDSMRTSTCGEPSPLFGTTCGQVHAANRRLCLGLHAGKPFLRSLLKVGNLRNATSRFGTTCGQALCDLKLVNHQEINWNDYICNGGFYEILKCLLRIGELGNWGIGELGNWGIGELGTWGIGELGNWGHGDLVINVVSPFLLLSSSPLLLFSSSPPLLVSRAPRLFICIVQ